MTPAQTNNVNTAQTGVDMKLEVVVLPVADVDRAKAFYTVARLAARRRLRHRRRLPGRAAHAARLRGLGHLRHGHHRRSSPARSRTSS